MLLVGVGNEVVLGVFVGVISSGVRAGVELWGGGVGVGWGCDGLVDFFLNRPRRSLRSLIMFSLCLSGEKVDPVLKIIISITVNEFYYLENWTFADFYPKIMILRIFYFFKSNFLDN